MPDLRPAVLLDVDGTLLDTNYLHVLAWWQAFEDTGRGPVAMSAIHRAIGIPSDGLVRQLIGPGGSSRDDEKTVDAHSRRYEPLRENVKPFPRTAELLRACADRGLAVVLATSGQESDLEWMMPAIGAEEVITGATTSGGVDEGKPAPDLLGVAMREHGLDPQRTVVVGDTVWDVEAAQRAGLPCIALTCGGIGGPELTDAGAAAVYNDPTDLLEHLDASPLARITSPGPRSSD